ncbi:hypothetical protein [Nesterenkonia populi]|uniref:hypothetical protein n=1 Tax=Nesterenkonia populi TaxID=1591087 RepID=UPI0011BFD999|nr:hypothetical protein [Nesterenkonia populi]
MPVSASPRGADRAPESPEEGSAIIEFLALTLLLILPVLWLITAAAAVQSAAYAATGAADQAAKVYAAAGDPVQAESSVATTLADFGIGREAAEVTRACAGPCDEPGTVVTYTVHVGVSMPAVPEFLGFQPQLLTVSSSAAHVRKEPE